MKRRVEAFTLIELLTVIAIIAILAALVLRTVGGVNEKAARSRAEAEINAVSLALEDYKRDNGDYPLNTSTSSCLILVTNLAPPTGKVYYAFTKNQTNSTAGFVDPFGNAYGYYYTTNASDTTQNDRAGQGFFNLWSTANKPTNSNAWIKNW